MEIECPFCSFTDFDLLYILEHVEQCHPDDSDSSSVTINNTGCLATRTNHEDGSSPHDTSKIEYIECECGEHVQLSEFTSHLALHESEEITGDSIPPSIQQSRASSIRANCATESAMEIKSQSRTPSGKKKTSKHANPRPCVAKAKHIGPRRLGVS